MSKYKLPRRGTRSKSHILKIMTRLLLLWMREPGLRLSQLIENVFRCGDNNCMYYVEDESFMRKLEEYYNTCSRCRKN